jgi:hypothetical protein
LSYNLKTKASITKLTRLFSNKSFVQIFYTIIFPTAALQVNGREAETATLLSSLSLKFNIVALDSGSGCYDMNDDKGFMSKIKVYEVIDR